MIAALVLAAPAAAEDGSASDGGWTFNLVPYLWLSGSDATVSHPGFPVEVKASTSFGEIFRKLDVGAMVALEGRRGRWGFLLDGLYAKLSDEATVGVPQLGGLPLTAAIGLRTFTGLAAVQYRAVDDGTGSLDIVAGPRFWSYRTRIDASLPAGLPLPPGIPPTYGRAETLHWVDAMAGAKAVVHLAPRLTLNAHAMFGAGGSRFSSDSLLAFGVAAGRNVSLLAGYRYLSANVRRDSGLAADMSMHGPIVGAGIRF